MWIISPSQPFFKIENDLISREISIADSINMFQLKEKKKEWNLFLLKQPNQLKMIGFVGSCQYHCLY